LHAGEGAQLASVVCDTASCSVRSRCHVAAVESDRVQGEEASELRELRQLLVGEARRVALELDRLAAAG
jgi:hypothetical protein